MNTIARTFLIFLIAMNAACTTFKPTAASTEQIQRLIQTERLLSPGDRVRLVTRDAREHDFRISVIDLDESLVIGANDAVHISEIVRLEKRGMSWLKTGLLIGGLVLATSGSECSDDCGEYGNGILCC
jgi:hypothetical protein